MSTKNAEVFDHVRQRVAERYGLVLTREVWESWNHALRQAASEEGLLPRSPQTVREVTLEGQKIIVLCSHRRVLTVITLQHATKLWSRSMRRAS